jgi:multicomponent Na+:H+ antiporter subunit G
MTVIAVVLVWSGVFFLFTGAVGIIRFPDFYTRMHAAGKCDTLGSLLILAGLAIAEGFHLSSLKLMVIALFIFFTSPTATHAIARAAHKNGVPFWTDRNSR